MQMEERIFSSLPGIGFKWNDLWPYVWGTLVDGPHYKPITSCVSPGEGFQKGEPIEFYHNYKDKERKFAPTITCISRQCFDVVKGDNTVTVYIDGFEYLTFVYLDGKWDYKLHRKEQTNPLDLIYNLGYYDIKHFLKAYPADFQGEIVHWTNASY